MSGTFDLLTLLFLVVAVIVILRLRSVLGRRTGSEKPRYDMARSSSDNVVSLGRQPVRARDDVAGADLEERLKPYADPTTPLADGLKAIAAADAAFDPQNFLSGARSAYEMIVTAYGQDNAKALKPLLNREVFESFEGAILERSRNGHKVDFKFVGIDRADILDAELRDRTALVTVKFVSQLITATRDKAGAVIDGDPLVIRDVTDIWTFSRDTASRDPNWRLIATESAN